MKKKIIFSAIALVVIFILAGRFSKKTPAPIQQQQKAPLSVTLKTAADSKELKKTISYPATVVGDQEITITAKASGSASAVTFDLGDKVYAGSLLVRIDDTGNTLPEGYKDFQSSQVQQSHLSKETAEESLAIAEKNYKDLKNVYDKQRKDPTLAKTVTKIQLDAAKGQIEVAEIQLKNAKVGLKGTLDDHLVTSSITGFITGKSVSVGDSIFAGQTLATISQTKNIKLQFFVDQDNLSLFPAGAKVMVSGSDDKKIEAVVKNISPAADQATKRFLVEAYPISQIEQNFASGTITTVSFETTKFPSVSDNLLLPLSAITIGQNESYIFINDNGRAKKVNVTVVSVEGEAAEVETSLALDAEIIMDGSKLVQDGDAIAIKN